MPSIFSTIHGGLSSPVITAFHGEDVIRWPAGVEASAATVDDAIWQPLEVELEGSINPQQTFAGTLSLLEGATIAEGDLWVIGDEQYSVKRVNPVNPATGRRELELVRAERAVTRNVGGAVTLVRGIR